MRFFSLLITLLLTVYPVTAQLHFTPNLNVELIGIVYNVATGYSVEDDGFQADKVPVFSAFYREHGEKVRQHEAVRLMKNLLELDVLWENEYFELGLYYDEFDFTQPNQAYSLPSALFDENRQLKNNSVDSLLKSLHTLSQESYIIQYFEEIYTEDYNLLLRNSSEKQQGVQRLYEKIPVILRESVQPEVRVIPAIHIEPYVGYGSLLYGKGKEEKIVLFFGLSLSNDGETTMGYSPQVFTHELIHPSVTRAMESPQYKEEKEILNSIFQGSVQEKAARTVDYTDCRSYFGETFTRALEVYIYRNFLGWEGYAQRFIIDEDKDDFIYLETSVEMLETYFLPSELSFYDFYPLLINGLK